MRLRSRLWLVMMLSGAGSAMGQVDTSAWPVVRMEVLAVDARGGTLAVAADSLVVTENALPVTGLGVAAAKEPQSVCVVVDSSGSMFARMLSVKTAASRLIDALPVGDEVCLVTFSNEAYVDAGLTVDREKAKKGLQYAVASGASSLFDTLDSTAAYLRRNAKFKSRAIVLLSDGDDNLSKKNLAGALAALYQGGAPAVHVFRLSDPAMESHADAMKAEKLATTLAGATGGMVYFPKKRGELEASVDELCRLMGNRVILSYETAAPARDGRERQVSVALDKTHQKQKAAVFAAEGYYAPSH